MWGLTDSDLGEIGRDPEAIARDLDEIWRDHEVVVSTLRYGGAFSILAA